MKYALTHCNILDSTKDMIILKDRMLIIEDEKIVAIEETNQLPNGATEIDMKGKYVLPGLINLHAHLIGSGKPALANGTAFLFKLAERSTHMQQGMQETVMKNSLNQLYSGVTTIRSLGEMFYTDIQTRDRINSGKSIGPRILAAGYSVSVPDGHMAGNMGKVCCNLEEAVDVVNEVASKKVDWIKIFVTGGILDASSSDDKSSHLKMSLEMAKAVCDKAHALGYKVASHAQSEEGVKLSLRAGVDTIEHGAMMDEETITLYKRNNAALIVTLSAAIACSKLPMKKTGMNAMQKELSKSVMTSMIQGAKTALEEGIPVGLGTDCGVPFVTQYDMWREIKYFAQYCQVSNAFALHTATLKNAEILGLAHEIGSIEIGKIADLIVLEENPIENLNALRKIEKIFVKGKLIDEVKVKKLNKLDKILEQIK